MVVALHLRSDRQLQHGCPLSGTEVGEQDDFPVRQLQGVVVCIGAVRIDVPEASQLSAAPILPEESEEKPARPDFFFDRVP
jgi:hypothetical protein